MLTTVAIDTVISVLPEIAPIDAKTAAAEFQRTVSRLHEMQSVQYLQQERARR